MLLKMTSKDVLESDQQKVPVKKCLSLRPNVQVCLTSKIQNVSQAMLVRLAGALIILSHIFVEQMELFRSY